MSLLSREIRNYLHNKGNQILFGNNLNLNQLALLMWEKLGYKEIDSSVLSKVINNKRLFTYNQLNAFCNILRINKQGRLRLFESLAKDILIKKNLFVSDSSPIIKLNYLSASNQLESLLRIISVMRENGFPQYAIDLFSLYQENNKDHYKKVDSDILARIFNQKSRAYGEISSSRNNLYAMKILNERVLAGLDKRTPKDIRSMLYMNIGGFLYLKKLYSYSSNFLENKYKEVDSITQAEFLRTLLLNSAYAYDYLRFKKFFLKSLKKLDKLIVIDKNIFASLIESMARSALQFGLIHQAINLLNSYKALYISPFYESQILRCKVLIFYYLNNKHKYFDSEELSNIIDRISDKKFEVYVRHRQQIKNLIKRMSFC